jgi:Domain of unknown function (DUF4399)
MYIKSLLSIGALLLGMVTAGALSADTQRSPSPAGATVGFANLADGDVVPPGFIARFTISGMEIAPAGSKIPNTGHFHLLINLDELPPMDQPLPATDQIVHFGKGQTETALELPDGEYRLQLLLADYAHVPHDPPVMSDVITITVSSAATMPDES